MSMSTWSSVRSIITLREVVGERFRNSNNRLTHGKNYGRKIGMPRWEEWGYPRRKEIVKCRDCERSTPNCYRMSDCRGH
jgi:hypothetical protein